MNCSFTGPIVEEEDLGSGTGKIWEMEMKARFRDADENKDGELHHPEVEHFLFPQEEDRDADEEALHILGKRTGMRIDFLSIDRQP